MNSPRGIASRLLFAATLLPAATLAQSGNPAPITPLKSADPRIAAMFNKLSQTRTPTDAAISPDGLTVAWAARTGASVSEIHLTAITPTGALDDASERVLTAGEGCSNTSSIWSPDGQSFAFLATCPDKGQQLYLWQKKDASLAQLTHLTGELQMPMFSPDGRKIAFLFVENATRNAGALAPMKPWNGVYGEDNVEVQRVAMINAVSGGEFNFITPASLHVYEFSWLHDDSVLYVAAPPPGENNWWVAQLYYQEMPQRIEILPDPKTNQWAHVWQEYKPHLLLDPQKTAGPLHGLQIAVPRICLGTARIAFIGGLMSDQGSTGGDIYLISALGGQPIDITPDHSGSPAWIDWLDVHTLKVVERANGGVRIFDYDVDKRTESNVLTLPESVSASSSFVFSLSLARKGKLALIRSSFDHPPEVWTGTAADLHQVTHLNDALTPAWGKSESIEWTNEGFQNQGWLLYPANYDPTKIYPLITYVHGGPSNATTPRWPSAAYGPVPFAALGYFVFMPNPRGSFGQGEKFTQANVKDFGYGDLRDILTGIDVLEKRLPIDKSREGLTGWSYGGFMTMFGVTQTNRFRAAVAGAGISNYQSYYGQNSIDQWLIPFFGKSVYDDPAVYAKSSPITFIKNVKTPTLVVVGDRDGECPAPQSFEFWHALRDQGVKTQLVVYPNEGHSFQDPTHRQDVLERAFDWFQTQMPAK